MPQDGSEKSQMSETKYLEVRKLSLDLTNYRTMPQISEEAAIISIVSTRPDQFWALMESLLDDGYLPTESIQVLKGKGKSPIYTVKEGNRRIATLKLIAGEIDRSIVVIPANLLRQIDELNANWRDANAKVPCVVYSPSESETVDRIVTLAHGKGEKAGRDQWNAVARARHNRDANKSGEPALDLLEGYLTNGKNLTKNQSARWAGDFPLTVLDEAMKRIATRVGVKNARELARNYPKLDYRDALEEIIKAIGLGKIGFEAIRRAGKDFGAEYGIPVAGAGKASKNGETDKDENGKAEKDESGTNEKKSSTKKKTEATRTDDTRTVKRLLSKFTPRGSGREKVVELRDEARSLNLNKNPLAFCFLLRSMFEISAKAYCANTVAIGGPSIKKSGGKDKTLEELLRGITKHLTKNKTDQAKVKELHGAMIELGKRDSLLSVTSMNQLVHNPNFLVSGPEVSKLFWRVFPLLNAMNE